MTTGDCYILKSDFHKKDIGMILLYENKREYIFTYLLFKNNSFDNTLASIYNSDIPTNIVYHSINFIPLTGIHIIHEYKKQPTYLTSFCLENKPFCTLNVDTEKLSIGQSTKDLTKIIVGGGTSIMGTTKEFFDKIDIQHLTIERPIDNKHNVGLILKKEQLE